MVFESLKLQSGSQILIIFDQKDEFVDKFKELLESELNNVTAYFHDLAHVDNIDKSKKYAACIVLLFNESTLTDGFPKLLTILRPGAKLKLISSVLTKLNDFKSSLKLSGFVNVQADNAPSSTRSLLKNDSIKNFDILSLIAEKPTYEIGDRVAINLNAKPSSEIWKLSAADIMDDDDDLMNSDDVLTEEDLLKPDPNSLRASCGVESTKRKACKNCTCGLADELEKEQEKTEQSTEQQQSLSKSACGNCYLGDAFRCAACPYLGMPAFKPGEIVQLPSQQ